MIFYSGNECCFVELGQSCCCLQLFCYIIIDGDNNVIIMKGGNCEHCVPHMLSLDLKLEVFLAEK